MLPYTALFAIVILGLWFLLVHLRSRKNTDGTPSPPKVAHRKEQTEISNPSVTRLEPAAPPQAPERLSLAAQMANLATCGILLRSDLSERDLFLEYGDDQEAEKEKTEKEPYVALLCTLAYPHPETEEGTPKSPNLWRLDTEDVDYADVARELSRLAGDDFPLTNIASSKYGEEENPWVSFELKGETYKWPFAFDGWLEPAHLLKFCELFNSLETGRHFACISIGDQTIFLCCLTPDQRDELSDVLDQEVDWLDEWLEE